MKISVPSIVGIVLTAPSVACAALVGLNLEEHAVDGLNGYTTWRLYAEFDNANDQLTSVGGANPTLGAIISYGGFYQNYVGGATSAYINSNFFPFIPELEYDSWVTIGGETTTDSQTLTTVGINFSSFEAGNDLFITNGEWTRPMNDPQAFGQVVGSMPNYQVLVGQFTIAGYGPNTAPWGQLNLSGFSEQFGLTGELMPWSAENVSFGTPVPAPGALALLGLAVLGAPRRRR
ncbi:MAG: hypothetical protein VX527_09365 [Planctomycetota bacterium]|nr:hypothetical protein [Planctomycetota bacterium]